MPILPLNDLEPFAATLGVMLCPGTDEHDHGKARVFAARWIAGSLSHYNLAGHRLPYEALLRIAIDAGEQLNDLDDRWCDGTATGELFKVMWALFNIDPKLASWNNAIKIARLFARRSKARGSTTFQWAARSRYLSVAHLWGAWCIREGQFGERRGLDMTATTTFNRFWPSPKFSVIGGKYGVRDARRASHSCHPMSGACPKLGNRCCATPAGSRRACSPTSSYPTNSWRSSIRQVDPARAAKPNLFSAD